MTILSFLRQQAGSPRQTAEASPASDVNRAESNKLAAAGTAQQTRLLLKKACGSYLAEDISAQTIILTLPSPPTRQETLTDPQHRLNQLTALSRYLHQALHDALYLKVEIDCALIDELDSETFEFLNAIILPLTHAGISKAPMRNANPRIQRILRETKYESTYPAVG